MKFICKILFRFIRRWGKTSNGKWHVIQCRFYTTGHFKPSCAPWTDYTGVDYCRKTPSSNVCKHCQALIDGGMA